MVKAETVMSSKTSLYIESVATLGIIALGAAVLGWHCENAMRFIVFLTAALIAACCKVKLPKVTGTYSLGFVPILAAVVALDSSETIVLAVAVGAMQCIWRPNIRPSVLQVLFNTAAVAVSAIAAHRLNTAVLQAYGPTAALGSLALAAATFWTLNTGLVSTTLSLLNEGSLSLVWHHWSMWTLPYYLCGAMAIIFFQTSIAVGQWLGPLLSLPMLVLCYVSWRTWVHRGAELE